jgi:superfamily II DNA or RNA helicase
VSETSAPVIETADVVRLVGRAAFERGQQYLRAGAVLQVSWNEQSSQFYGVVQGGARQPYRCYIPVILIKDGPGIPNSGVCSCPVERDCKHIAAALLAAGADSAGQTVTGAAWKSAVSSERAPSLPWAAPANTELALMFELREQTPRTPARWNGPVARTTHTFAADPTDRLAVRPAVRGKSGKWTKQVTWSTLPHQQHRRGFELAQIRWFQQFVGVYRSTRFSYYAQDADWLYLDDFASPLLWPLLENAVRLGIPLVANQGVEVEVASEATIALDLQAAERNGIRLLTIFEIDGARAAPERAVAIGDHGIYSIEPDGPRIVLAPTTSPLTDDQRRLLGRPGQATIPASDVREFLIDFYPRLRRGVAIGSADGSVPIPEILPPTLVLTVTHSAGKRMRLDLTWEYDVAGHLIELPLEATTANKGDRDAAAEAATIAELREIPGIILRSEVLVELDAAEYFTQVLPAIAAADGVRVDTVGQAPDYRELVEPPHLSVKTHESDRTDWFDLGVTVTVEGRQIPFNPLFKALAKGNKKLLLSDNSYLSLDQPVFDALRELIEEAAALAEWETAPRISRFNQSLWSDFEDLADEAEPASTWRAIAADAEADGVEPTPLPTSLNAELRPYQKLGFDWLVFLWRNRLGGILADDMGLGKTLQSLALIAHAVEQRDVGAKQGKPDAKPFLVVAPTSVVSNWVREAERFTPQLSVAAITQTQSKSATATSKLAGPADVVVTSYALLRLDADAYSAIEWAGVLFDEAQFLKNPASRAHDVAVRLSAPFKLALTGTPLENSVLDLWSLFSITAPGLFPSASRFTKDYVRPIERGSSARARRESGVTGVSGERADLEADAHALRVIARLRRRIRPLMMRRTKELVASDLPTKQEQELRVELAPRHRRLYDTVLQRERRKLFGLLDDLDRNRFIVLRSLTLLRMLSLDASLVDEKYADVPSSKLDALFEQLEDVLAEGHRALMFSQFTSYLGKVAQRLDALGIEYAYLDGATRGRAAVIDEFKTGTAQVFLISLKAGGFGLNLTEADYVFMLDPWWNPATEMQAIDRTHRIGQTRNVMVYRMIASGTIEEKVMALKARKAALFDAIVDDEALFSSALTADDIRSLLE